MLIEITCEGCQPGRYDTTKRIVWPFHNPSDLVFAKRAILESNAQELFLTKSIEWELSMLIRKYRLCIEWLADSSDEDNKCRLDEIKEYEAKIEELTAKREEIS